jgi:predicted Rossmann fold flavoprotein
VSTANVDVVIIGAGAAGMMCAAEAGKRGSTVMLIDHYPHLGEKIRISGGGRCNFTNINTKPENFLSQNSHFCRSALARYTPRHFISLVESHGIKYHEKTLGQLFCDDSATQIIYMLKTECDRAKVQWRRPCVVIGVEKIAAGFSVQTALGLVLAKKLVIATGGLAVPKIGATPFGYKIAEQFGLSVITPRAALVPLSFDSAATEQYGDLSGLSLDATVRAAKNTPAFKEALLLTHRGLSGPSILQVSSYWQDGSAKDPIHINLLPFDDAKAWVTSLRQSRQLLSNLLAEHLPKRFAKQWCDAFEFDVIPNQISDKKFKEITEQLFDWQVKPSGTLGYNKAEVTLGGVNTQQLSSKTMEANAVPGLYFIGEVVDVTGHLGGYNFQWAWASGVAAGVAAGAAASMTAGLVRV